MFSLRIAMIYTILQSENMTPVTELYVKILKEATGKFAQLDD